MTDPEEYDPDFEFVKRAYGDDNLLVGNFVEKYCNMLDPIAIIGIESKVRNYILKKFPNREERAVDDSEDNVKDEIDEV